MKILYLIRHAKASWEDPSAQDFDRPLTEVGKKDAQEMAGDLKKKKIKPDLILTSPAIRALTTAEIMADVLNYDHKKITTSAIIYSGGMEEILEMIKDFSSKANTVMLFGHNPSLTWLTHYLCDDAKMNIPTCGVIGIEFKMTNWKHLSDSECKLITFVHPEHAQH